MSYKTKDVNPELVRKLYAKYSPNVDVEKKMSHIQSKYGNNQDDFVRNFYAKYDPSVDVDSKLEYIKKAYPVKKKEHTEYTSRENLSESQPQQSEEQATSGTDVQKMELDSDTSIGEQNNAVELSDAEVGVNQIPFDSRIEEGSVNIDEAKAWVDANTSLSEDEERGIEEEYEKDSNNEGFFNTVTSIFKEAWNQKVGRDSSLSIDPNPLVDKIKEAKKVLEEEGIESTPETLKQKTKELYVNEKRKSLVQSKTNEALGTLPQEIKDKLKVKNREDYKKLNPLKVDAVNNIKIKELDLGKKISEAENLKQNINSQDDVDAYNELASEINSSKNDLLTMIDDFSEIQEDIDDLDEGLDNLKRSYSSWDNFVGRLQTSSASAFGQGSLGFVDLVNDVRKKITGDDGLTYFPGSILPIPTPAITQKNKEIGEWIEEKESTLRKDIDEVNSVGDFMDMTVDVVATQLPNMLPFVLGGGAGAVVTGMTSAGSKSAEMKTSNKKYTDNQLIIAPLVSGTSTAILGAIPTSRLITRGKGLFKEVMKTNKGRAMLQESKTKVINKLKNDYVKGMSEEIPTEIADQVVQNIIDIEYLDNPNNIELSEGLDKVVKDTALFTSVMTVFPFVGGSIAKKIMPKSNNEKLNKNAFDIIKLRNQLQMTEDPVLIKDIEGRISVKMEENKSIYKKAEKTIKDTPSELMDKVLENDNKMISIREVAKSVKNSNLSEEAKKERLEELKVEFDNLAEFNDKVLEGESNVLEALDSKQVLKLKDKAQKELSKEMIDKGEENFTIEDDVITERAIQLYNEQKQVEQLKEELKNEEAEQQDVQVESETRESTDTITEQENETEADTQEEGEVNLSEISELDLTNEESKSKVISFLEEAEVALNNIDDSLKKHGEENLSMGLPIVTTRVAVKAMKVAVVSAKTGAEVIQAGIDAVQNSSWYKNLNETQQKEFNDNAFEIVSNNVTKEVGNQVRNKKESDLKNRVEKKRKVALKNLKKGKIGNIRWDNKVFVELASIPLSSVPKHVRNKYVSIIDNIGKRAKVIDIENDVAVKKDIDEIIEAVNEENNKVSSLRLAFDKFVEDNPSITDFNEIVKGLRDGEIISEEDSELIKKRKDSFFESKRESKHSAEAKRGENESNIRSKVKGLKSNSKNTNRELENLRKIKTLTNEDISKLSDAEVKYLSQVIDHIESSGRQPSVIQDIIRTVEANRKQVSLLNEMPKVKNKARHIRTKVKVAIKNAFKFNTSQAKQRIKQVDLSEIDMQLGNKKNTNIFKAVFGNLSKIQSAYESKISDVAGRLVKARDLLGSDNNAQVESGMKITMYMIARYKASNPDVGSIFYVSEYVDETVNLSGDKFYSKKEKQKLSEVAKDFIEKDESGNESADAMYDKLSTKEKKAVKAIREELDRQSDEAYDTSLFDNHNASPFLKDYFPLNTVGKDFDSDLKAKMSNFSNPSFSSGNLSELTATEAHSVSFNPFSASLGSIRSTSFQNSFLHESRVLNKMFNDMLSDRSIDIDTRDFIHDIKWAYDNQIDSMVGGNFGDATTGMLNDISSFVKKAGYRTMLGGAVRGSVEFVSNLTAAVVAHGSVFNNGVDIVTEVTDGGMFHRNEKLRMFLINLGCSQVDRFTNPSIDNVGRVDFNTSEAIREIGNSNLESETKRLISNAYKKTGLGKIPKGIGMIHDTLISAPDTITSLPVWVGRFSEKFKELTGEDVDLDKVISKDRVYFDKHHLAINKASDKANRDVNRIASSKNKFEGASAEDSNGAYKFYYEYKNFFRSFMKKEFTTMKQALHDSVLEGEMSKREASALLLAVMMRQFGYGLGIKYLGGFVYGGISSLMGYEDDDSEEVEGFTFPEGYEPDEEAKKFLKMVSETKKKVVPSKGEEIEREILGVALSTGLGIAVGTGSNTTNYALNQLAEWLNYEYGEGFTRLEGEEYDRFENGVFRPFISPDKMNATEFTKSGVKAISGAHSPFVNSVLSTNMMGVAAGLNLVPFYKDVKAQSNHLKYETAKGEESTLAHVMSMNIPKFMDEYIKEEEGAMTDDEIMNMIINQGGSKSEAKDFLKSFKEAKKKYKEMSK